MQEEQPEEVLSSGRVISTLASDHIHDTFGPEESYSSLEFLGKTVFSRD